MLAVVPNEGASSDPATSTPASTMNVSLPFAWSQTDDGVSILIACSPNFTKEDVEVEVTDDSVSVKFRGEELHRVRGKLFGKVDRFSAVWQLEKKGDTKLLIVELDKEKAEKWPILIRGPDAEDGLDAHSRFVLAQIAREEGNGELALALYEQAAEDGYVEAILTFAAFHLLGNEEVPDVPVTKDSAMALEMYKRAAGLGSIEAMYVIGGLYQQGLETAEGTQEPDYPLAVQYFDRVIMKPGSKERNANVYLAAAFQAGLLCLEGGHGLGEADPGKALSYWRYSIENAHPPSMFNAAILFLNGYGTKRDVSRAGRLFAAAQSMDSKLVPPAELAGVSREGLDKLAALDSELQERGEQLTLPELLARFGTSEGSTQGKQPQPGKRVKKKVKGKGKKASATSSAGSGTAGTVLGIVSAVAVVGLAVYAIRRSLYRPQE